MGALLGRFGIGTVPVDATDVGVRTFPYMLNIIGWAYTWLSDEEGNDINMTSEDYRPLLWVPKYGGRKRIRIVISRGWDRLCGQMFSDIRLISNRYWGTSATASFGRQLLEVIVISGASNNELTTIAALLSKFSAADTTGLAR